MEELERVQISDVLSCDISTQQEELDAILAELLHQESISRVRGVFHTKDTDKVKVLSKVE